MNTNQIVLNDFFKKHPFAAAKLLEQQDAIEVTEFFKGQSLNHSIQLLGLMESKKAALCFSLLPSQRTKQLMEQGDSSFIASILKLIEDPMQTNLLSKISAEKRAIIKRKLAFKPNTVGALTEPAIIVNREMTVDNAVEIFKKNSVKEEFYLYVVDLDGAFEGIVRLRELLLANDSSVLEEVMITSIPKYSPEQLAKSVLTDPEWFEYRHIPVVDKFDKLLGFLPYKTTVEMTSTIRKTYDKDILETSGALGELYRIGLTGLIQSAVK